MFIKKYNVKDFVATDLILFIFASLVCFYSEFLATELKDIRRHVADILLLRDGFDIKQKKAKQTIPEEAEGRQLSTRAHGQ